MTDDVSAVSEDALLEAGWQQLGEDNGDEGDASLLQDEDLDDCDDEPPCPDYEDWATGAEQPAIQSSPGRDAPNMSTIGDIAEQDGWTQGTLHVGFDDDGWSTAPAHSFLEDDWAQFEQTGTGDFEIAPTPIDAGPALTADQVNLIKTTMAEVHITPPPWVRKIQQVTRIRTMQEQQAAVGVLPPPVTQQDLATPEQYWSDQVLRRAPTALQILSGDTIANASPSMLPTALPAMPLASAAGVVMSTSGVFAPKRVSARQLAAERRKAREDRKRAERAAAAERIMTSG